MELAHSLYLGRQRGLAMLSEVFFRKVQQVVRPSQEKPEQRHLDAVDARFEALLERDWKNAVQGYYPRELLFDTKPLRELVTRLPAMLAAVPGVLSRSKKGVTDALPQGVDRSRYPRYYLRTFHWQTDGWFSKRSARIYDASVDLLFGGTSDVMRRQTLPPIVDAVKDKPRPRILDVACGTGRFLRQLRAAVPGAAITGLDLSPHYIAYARELLKDDGELSLVVDNAEAMPFKDASFDAVTSVFLFHELPKDARRHVMQEIARVLAPGGTVSICDSAQLIESADLSPFLENFARDYHEPFYKGYTQDPLEALVQAAGLELVSSEPHLVSKVVVARKPVAN